MKPLNYDHSHKELFSTSKKYLIEARNNADEGDCERSYYLYRRSVEESCRYIGLTFRILDPLMDIPDRRFDRAVQELIFTNDIMKVYGIDDKFDELSILFWSIEDRTEKFEILYSFLSDSGRQTVIERPSNSSATLAFLDYFSTNPYSHLIDLQPLMRMKAKNLIGNVEKECKIAIDLINSYGVCFYRQMVMSFIARIGDPNVTDSKGRTIREYEDILNFKSAMESRLDNVIDYQRWCLEQLAGNILSEQQTPAVLAAGYEEQLVFIEA